MFKLRRTLHSIAIIVFTCSTSLAQYYHIQMIDGSVLHDLEFVSFSDSTMHIEFIASTRIQQNLPGWTNQVLTIPLSAIEHVEKYDNRSISNFGIQPADRNILRASTLGVCSGAIVGAISGGLMLEVLHKAGAISRSDVKPIVVVGYGSLFLGSYLGFRSFLEYRIGFEKEEYDLSGKTDAEKLTLLKGVFSKDTNTF